MSRQTRLKNKKQFSFRSFQGREPTTSELLTEMEEMYKFIINQVDESLEDLRAELVPDEDTD